jgi:hypothetical protein
MAALNEVREILDFTEDKLMDSVSTWSAASQPKFEKSMGKGAVRVGGESFGRSGDLTGAVFTSSTPYVYVIGGTSIRKRQMSRDFRPKSRPRSLAKSRGSGKAIGPPKHNLPGIEKRNHHEIVAKQFAQERFTRAMKLAMSRAANKAFGPGGSSATPHITGLRL